MSYNDFLETGDLVAGRYNQHGVPQELPQLAGSAQEIKLLESKISKYLASSGGERLPSLNGNKIKLKKIKNKVIKDKIVPTIKINKMLDPEYLKYYDEEKEETEIEEKVVSKQDEERLIPQKRISFSNQFGFIRMEAEEVLYQDEFGILIIFSNDSKLTFIPKAGETLQFCEGEKLAYTVFYPGSLFTLGDKKIMILFNKKEEND